MIAYFVFLGASLLYGNLFTKKKFFCFFIGLTLFLFLSLRSITVGGDLVNYELQYKTLHQTTIQSYYALRKTEILYVLFAKTCATISNGNFRFFLVACAFVFSIFFSISVYHLSDNQPLSWFYTICFSVLVYCLSGLRSSFGLVFGLMGCVHLFNPSFSKKKRHLFKFYFFVVIAFLFHYTSIIFAFVPLFLFLKKKKNYYYAFFIICFAVLLIGKTDFFYRLGNFFFPTKEYEISSSRGYGALIICLIIRLGVSIFTKNKYKKNSTYLVVCGLFEFSFLCQLLALSFSLWSRVTSFVFALALILFPNCLKFFNLNKNSLNLLLFAVGLVLVLYYIFELIKDSASIVPYKFLWEEPQIVF